MLLLFDYILGGAIGQGLGAAARGAPYIDYLVAGILVMTVAGGCGPTAINVTMDMTGGFVDRIRTMAVTRGALLAGHVGVSVMRMLVATIAVTGVALLIGFRPRASVTDWFAVFGIIAAFAFALAWLSAAIGLVTKSVAGANGSTLPVVVPAAVSVQHLRAGELNAHRRALVCREPAVHRGGGQPACAA